MDVAKIDRVVTLHRAMVKQFVANSSADQLREHLHRILQRLDSDGAPKEVADRREWLARVEGLEIAFRASGYVGGDVGFLMARAAFHGIDGTEAGDQVVREILTRASMDPDLADAIVVAVERLDWDLPEVLAGLGRTEAAPAVRH